jgi:hypothetical protein
VDKSSLTYIIVWVAIETAKIVAAVWKARRGDAPRQIDPPRPRRRRPLRQVEVRVHVELRIIELPSVKPPEGRDDEAA